MNIDKDKMISDLKAGVCEVVFTKANGDTRTLVATLKEELLPKAVVSEQVEKKEKKTNPNVLAVFDVENDGWRSFRWDSLKKFNTEFNT